MEKAHPIQFSLIKAVKDFNISSQTADNRLETLDDGGVCLSLSMLCARSHMIIESNEENPGIFKEFLQRWHSVSELQKFVEDYERAQTAYIDARHNHHDYSVEDIKAFSEAFKRLQTQQAYYEAAVLTYAGIQTPKADYAVDDIRPTSEHEAVFSLHGLKYTSPELYFSVRTDELDDFIFSQNEPTTSKFISPFTAGGTYIVLLPGHACQLHIDAAGHLTFYDPSYTSFVSSKEDLTSYKAFFAGTYVGDSSQVLIRICSVGLKQEELQRPELLDLKAQVQSQLYKATDCFLQQYDISSAQAIQSLPRPYFWNNFFLGISSIRLEILRNMIETTANDNTIRQDINRRVCNHFIQSGNDAFLQIILADKSFTQKDFNRLLNQAFATHSADIILKLIACAPTKFLLTDSPDRTWITTLQSRQYHSGNDILLEFIQSAPENLILSLCNSRWDFSSNPKEDNEKIVKTFLRRFDIKGALELLLPTSPSLRDLLIIELLDSLQKDSQRTPFFVNGMSLIDFMIKNHFEEEIIISVIKSDSYSLSQKDYDQLLESTYSEAKALLLVPGNDFPGVQEASDFRKAILRGDTQSLIDHLSSTSIPIEAKLQAIDDAAQSGHFDIADIIIDRETDTEKNRLISRVLCQALARDRIDIVMKYIINKCDISEIDQKILGGKTFLTIAAEKGYIELITTLLDSDLYKYHNNPALTREQYINATLISTGETALMRAMRTGQYEAVKTLIRHGADFCLADKDGQSPLTVIIDKSGHNILMKALSDDDSDIVAAILGAPHLPDSIFQQKNSAGEDASLIALNESDVGIFKQVTDKAKNIPGALNATLFRVVTFRKTDKLQHLIGIGAPLDVVNSEGQTLLMAAITWKKFEAVNLLLESRKDILINNQDNNGDTALIFAVRRRNLSMIQALVDKGALIDTANKHNKTTLSIAKELQPDSAEKSAIIEFLTQKIQEKRSITPSSLFHNKTILMSERPVNSPQRPE